MTGSASALQRYRGLKVSEERLSYNSYIYLVHLIHLVHPLLLSGHALATIYEKRHN